MFDWRKSGVKECIFVYMASHIECRFNKNALLRCHFLAILPAGLQLVFNPTVWISPVVLANRVCRSKADLKSHMCAHNSWIFNCFYPAFWDFLSCFLDLSSVKKSQSSLTAFVKSNAVTCFLTIYSRFLSAKRMQSWFHAHWAISHQILQTSQRNPISQVWPGQWRMF